MDSKYSKVGIITLACRLCSKWCQTFGGRCRMKTTQPIQDYRNNDKNDDNDTSNNFISASMSHVVTSALVSKSLISIRHICLILKLFCHIIIINDNNNVGDDDTNNKTITTTIATTITIMIVVVMVMVMMVMMMMVMEKMMVIIKMKMGIYNVQTYPAQGCSRGGVSQHMSWFR